MKNKIINILQVIMVFGIGFLLMIQLFQRLSPESDGLFGFRTFVIISDSMEPRLSIGDVILVKNVPGEKINPGDIISYYGESEHFKNKIITHEVVKVQTESDKYIYYARGLQNNIIDPAIYEEQLYGKMVYKFLILSLISTILRNKIGFMLLVVLPLILLFVDEITKAKNDIDERR